MTVYLTIKRKADKAIIKKQVQTLSNIPSEAKEQAKLEWLTNYLNIERSKTQKIYPESFKVAMIIAGNKLTITAKTF